MIGRSAKGSRVTNKSVGYTLLELIMAMSLLSVITTGTSLALRSSRQAWEAFEATQTRIRTGHALVREIIRNAREGASVVSVTGPSRMAGALTIQVGDGNQLTWRHDSRTRRVMFEQTLPVSKVVLAENIQQLRFEARNADMQVYQAGATDRIQHVWIEATVDGSGQPSSRRTITGAVWIRPFGRNRPE